MAPPTPVTAPPPDSESPPSPNAPPPEDADSPPPPPPPPSEESPPSPSPPPPSKSPPSSDSPAPKSSPPPPSSTSPPPPSNNSSSPPPPSSDNSSQSPPPPPVANKSQPATATPSPPPPKAATSAPESSTSSGSNAQLGYIIRASLVVGLIIIIMIVICSRRSKKKKREHDQMQYYNNNPHQHKGGEQYYNNQNWHNGHHGTDHVVKLNPQPGGGWSMPTQPPHSADTSSNFSGPHHPAVPPPPPNLAFGLNKSTFTYDELAAATGGFAQENLLGQGGFGYVHKGVLPNGKEIAVKSLKSGSGQGEREFQAEVEIISRVHHRHLVSLSGYCIAGGQRMLVYEFVPNKTLEHHLHGKGLPVMDWQTRLRIALGSAKGLAYLHEDCHPRIIHRDIKAANILLDENFEAMVADFGLAKLSSDNYTHVSTRVMGTFGYLAPEYASSGKLTEKSDVFSYGVMLLELITGKRPVDNTNTMEDSLVDWARPLLAHSLEDGNFDELADPMLERNYVSQEMKRMVACAGASIRHSARKRPKMSQIVRALEGDVSLDDLNEGVRPGQSSIYGSSMTSEYSQSSYDADMKKFRQIALSSQEVASSDYTVSSGDSQEVPQKPSY